MEKRERDIESGLRKQVKRMGGKFMKFTSPGNDGVPDPDRYPTGWPGMVCRAEA